MADRPRTITIICGLDRRAHETPEVDVIASRRSGDRQYQTICGYHFKLLAPRVAIGAPRCEQCAAVLAAANQPEPTAHRPERPSRRLGWRS